MNRNLHLMSGEAYTPRVCLLDSLDQVEGIEYVGVVFKMKDGTVQTTFSRMPISQAAYLSACMARRVHNLIEECAEGG